jgi:hypothetical protein
MMMRMAGSSDWSSFQALDDDDDDDDVLNIAVDRREYAVENDDPEVKAAVGSGMPAPSIERNADPIQVPVGMYRHRPLPVGMLFGLATFPQKWKDS